MRKSLKLNLGILSAALLLQGCVQTPLGPTVAVLPAPGKPFDQFQQDQGVCSQYAGSMVQGQAQRANNTAVGTALIGTALGAGLGAAIGGGYGAGVGAASGAVLGTGVGAGGSANAQGGIQQQYDNAYVQCMISRGNRLPAPPPVVVQQAAPVIVQPAPYYVQPAPYYARPY
jgi:hypothetical protein